MGTKGDIILFIIIGDVKCILKTAGEGLLIMCAIKYLLMEHLLSFSFADLICYPCCRDPLKGGPLVQVKTFEALSLYWSI